ncbi:MAG: class I SAM-dependent methyltransferase [Verrucomicrobiota bacterium]
MTLFDFHLHWYPPFKKQPFQKRIGELAAKYKGIVGVVYDTDFVECWPSFLLIWQQFGLSEVEESDVAVSGVWEQTGTKISFFRGSQVVSEENVELLVWGKKPEAGPLGAMIHEGVSNDDVVILPWGFGKWRGARGELIAKEFGKTRPGLFAGDSGTRPDRGVGSRFIAGVWKEWAGSRRLDGSDPLPMNGEEANAFSAGMLFKGEIPRVGDVTQLKAWLVENGNELEPIRKPFSSVHALKAQVRLRRKGFSFPQELPSGFTGESDRGDIESATDRYARRFSGDVGAFFLERQRTLALELAERMKTEERGETASSLLDLGGGHAQYSPEFHKRGWTVSIFASHESCRRRPDRLLGEENYRFSTGDLLHLPYPDDSFDVVTAFRLITHERSWEKLIAEAVRVSRCGVIVDYPDLRSFNFLSGMFFLLKKGIEKDTRKFSIFRRKQIVAAMRKAGVAEFQWRPQFFLPMALYRMAGSGRLAKRLEAVFGRIGLTSLFGSPVIVSAKKEKVL